MGTAVPGVGVAAPPPTASSWNTPRQLSPRPTSPAAAGVGMGTRGEDRGCRTTGKPHPVQRQIKHPLLLSASHDEFGLSLVSPSTGNVFAKEEAAVKPPYAWDAQGAGCPGAGSCLAEHPWSCCVGVRCRLLCVPAPREAAAPHSSP